MGKEMERLLQMETGMGQLRQKGKVMGLRHHQTAKEMGQLRQMVTAKVQRRRKEKEMVQLHQMLRGK